ncbi:MAG TPA: DEAD/DEAH box helicase, partial [Bacteroidetes bacterium]|nr:DEAD/DEAH box helicase [Bacteroidota bacterium]
ILATVKKREKKRSFYLTPLKAIAEEKFEEFREKYTDWGLNVAITTGERSEYDANLMEYDLIIATYEKLDALLIRNPNLIKDIGLIIVDELQMIGDEKRGINLEILLSKIIYTTDELPQIIGLSATIPNAEELGEWLKAEVIKTEKREVELREGIVYTGDKEIEFEGHKLKKGDFLYREFNTGNIDVERDLNIHTVSGLIDISTREQVIIFESTRKKAENLAIEISKQLPPSSNVTEWISKIDILVESTPSTRQLKKCMLNGVAFHHAGLSPEEKRIVEEAFEKGAIRIICSTLTLGAGVNTPAKTVIIRSTQFWDGRSIKSRDYKNMAGRAGRIKYHDDFGRSVLFAETEKDFERYWQGYINLKAERVESQIRKRQDNIESSILKLTVSGICKNVKELIKFIENTFFGYLYYQKIDSSFKQAFEESISEQIQELIKMGMLEEVEGELKATELGKRCAEEMISPHSAYIIFQALEKINEKEVINYNELIEPIIHLACCTSDARLLYPPISKQEKMEIFGYWMDNESNYLFHLHPDDENLILSVTKTTQMLLKWITGVPYSDLESFAPHGIIRNIGENVSWIVKSIKR